MLPGAHSAGHRMVGDTHATDRQALAYHAERQGPTVTPAQPSLRARVFTWLVALSLLCGASGLLYHVATSDDFRVARISVAGNELLSRSELEQAAAATGANIFWVKQEEVRERLLSLPAVRTARVSTVLPNRVDIRIGERIPVAVWQSAGVPFLVDQEGRVLGSSPTARSLPTIRDLSQEPLRPGSSVDTAALETMSRLGRLLPEMAGIVPREFEYSIETGLIVLTEFGSQVRFGGADDLEWKVRALMAIRQELDKTRQRATLIDVRFKDRPYVR